MADALIKKYTDIIAAFPANGAELLVAVLNVIPQIVVDINKIEGESAVDKKALIISIVNAGIDKLKSISTVEIEVSILNVVEKVVDWQLDQILTVTNGVLSVTEPSWLRRLWNTLTACYRPTATA